MEFKPNNNVVKRCLQGMDMKEKGEPEEALNPFLQAWDEATNSFEKFIATHYVPFYNGTKADLHPGDLLTAGGSSTNCCKIY